MGNFEVAARRRDICRMQANFHKLLLALEGARLTLLVNEQISIRLFLRNLEVLYLPLDCLKCHHVRSHISGQNEANHAFAERLDVISA